MYIARKMVEIGGTEELGDWEIGGLAWVVTVSWDILLVTFWVLVDQDSIV